MDEWHWYNHLTGTPEGHFFCCYLVCSRLRGLQLSSLCFSVFFPLPPFLHDSLHVWDAVLPDCLGIGLNRLCPCMCVFTHSLLKCRLLFLRSGDPGRGGRWNIQLRSMEMLLCESEYSSHVTFSSLAVKWQAFVRWLSVLQTLTSSLLDTEV